MHNAEVSLLFSNTLGDRLAAAVGFFGFDSLMELVGFAIAIAVAFQAMKGYTLAKERTLLYLNFSFILLGAGLLVEGLANLVVLFSRFHRGGLLFLSSVGYTINFFAEVLAFGILIFAYLQQTRAWSMQLAAAALPIMLVERNPFTELILIFLLVYIAAQTAINYSISKTTNALLVFSAFTSLVIGHVFFLLFTVSPIFFPFAHIFQLFGFLLLLAMLFRVNQAR
ncbi:MAG: hypothetical protein ABSF09_00475 [Candidatus Bathyarchaeia archaeon]|jgi:hypothetical protein